MQSDKEDRARRLAAYMIDTGGTVRSAGKHFGLSKSTVHKDLTQRLQGVQDQSLRFLHRITEVYLFDQRGVQVVVVQLIYTEHLFSQIEIPVKSG